MGAIGAVEESSLAQAQEVFNVNVFGVMRMRKAVLPLMRAQGRGRIINLSSVVGVLPSPYMAAYAASKHGIDGFSESLDHEVREHGVRALLVEPAYTSTGFDAPVMVAKVIVAASTDPKPKLRYTAGSMAGRASILRRIAPAGVFDKQIRKLHGLAG